MPKTLRVNATTPMLPAMTLEGRLESHATRHLLVQDAHHILSISHGVALLMDETYRQPLFDGLIALIPAGCPHRITVMGDDVRYKALHVMPTLYTAPFDSIVVFKPTSLETNLLQRIDIQEATDLQGLTRDCLDLFLKLLSKSMLQPANIARLPEASQPLTREIVTFIESSHTRPLTMDDFTAAFPYSGRHLSRLFGEDLGLTMFDYLRLYRIHMASVAMADRSATILQCATAAGYEAQSTFYHDFKEIYGMSPKVFRQRIFGEADQEDN